VFGEQISSTIWTKNCLRGTNIVNIGNKNIATRNTSFLTPGTRILLLRNTSCLLKEQDYYIEEQIMCTKKTRILQLRNKSRLLREQYYCVRGTNLVDTRNKKIVFEEQISSTMGTRIKMSSTQGKKVCSRNKSDLPWELQYCVWGTNLIYYMEQELRL
jgi:hypothetical protein